MRQVEFGSVHNLLAQRLAASDADCLGTVMGLVAASAIAMP